MSGGPEENNRQLVRLWRIWKTTHEMCRDRGYEISQPEIDISLDDFREKYSLNGAPERKLMSFSADPSPEFLEKHATTTKAAQAIGKIWVEFNGDPTVGVKQLRKFGHEITEGNFMVGIFISSVNVASAATKILPTLLPHVVEIFNEQDLIVNITKHELVPKHLLLSTEEKMELLKRYRVKETQLPRIQVSDPMSRYLGLRKGQVVKIIRKSDTAGRYASYRWVI